MLEFSKTNNINTLNSLLKVSDLLLSIDDNLLDSDINHQALSIAVNFEICIIKKLLTKL
jgi:hypothetical protein